MKSENWLDLAKMDYDDSLYLFKGARYPNAVYHVCQAVEKILKAAQVKFKNTVPRKTHQLGDLAKASGLEFTLEQTKFLEALAKDYGRVRYSDYARTFYNTKAKVDPLFKKAQQTYLWILTKLESN
jgi:HEPN domain-containing protein